MERTGSVYTFTSSAQVDSETVTVPADADICVVAATLFKNTSNWLPANPFTLGGANLTTEQKTDEQTDNSHVWLGYKVSPATGSQTLAWDWGQSPGQGALITVAFYRGVDTITPIVDSDQQLTAGTDLTGLTASGDDMMVGAIASYGALSSVTDNSQTELYLSLFNQTGGGFAEKLGGTGFYFTGGGYTTCAALVLNAG